MAYNKYYCAVIGRVIHRNEPVSMTINHSADLLIGTKDDRLFVLKDRFGLNGNKEITHIEAENLIGRHLHYVSINLEQPKSSVKENEYMPMTKEHFRAIIKDHVAREDMYLSQAANDKQRAEGIKQYDPQLAKLLIENANQIEKIVNHIKSRTEK